MSILNDILSGLFQDPTQQGGGAIYQWLSPQSAAATSTPMAAPSSPGVPGGAPTPPAAAQNSGGGLLSQFFQPHRGLLGNSLAGDAVRGGLAGLGNSTGYTGLAALGQGAMGAADAGARRRQGQMNAAAAGQQFQSGQNQLAYQPAMLNQQYQLGQGQLVNQALSQSWTLDQINYIRHLQDPTAAALTQADLFANPALATNPTAGLAQAPTQTGQGAPGSAAQTQMPQQPVGMAPVVGGQPGPGQAPIDPHIAASMPAGGSVPGYPTQAPTQALPQTPQQAPIQAPSQNATPAPSPSAPTLPPVPPELQQALQTAMMGRDFGKIADVQAKIFEYQHASQQAASVEDAKAFSRSGVNKNLADLSQRFTAQPAVKTMQEIEPMHQAVLAAEKAHAAAKGKDEQLTSDMDLTNELLKFWNPNNANLRPNTVEAAQEAMGWSARLQKLQQEIMGGTGLSKEVRKTMLDSIETHYSAYKTQYDNTVANFNKQATAINGGQAPDESLWRGDAPQAQQGPAKISSDADYAALPSGSTYIAPDGSTRTKQ